MTEAFNRTSKVSVRRTKRPSSLVITPLCAGTTLGITGAVAVSGDGTGSESTVSGETACGVS